MYELPDYKDKDITITKDVVNKTRRTKSSIKRIKMFLDKLIG